MNIIHSLTLDSVQLAAALIQIAANPKDAAEFVAQVSADVQEARKCLEEARSKMQAVALVEQGQDEERIAQGHRAAGLSAREAALAEREASLEQSRASFVAECEVFAGRETALANREAARADIEKAANDLLDAREAALNQRAADLDARAAEVNAVRAPLVAAGLIPA